MEEQQIVFVNINKEYIIHMPPPGIKCWKIQSSENAVLIIFT
jgi:hypothetical protein